MSFFKAYERPYNKQLAPTVVNINGENINIFELEPRSISLDTYRTIKASTDGFRMLYPYLDDEALIHVTKHTARNCSPRYPVTYEWALVYHIVPELIKRLQEMGEAMKNTRCAYCGEGFVEDSPEHADAVTEHIRTCPKHPMRQLEEEIKQLRSRLTCMCGEWMDRHPITSDHFPISMYDYELDTVTQERDELRDLLDEVILDFDPEYKIGPPLSPEIFKKIKRAIYGEGAQ